MQEVRNVNSRQVDFRCPECQNGWMRPSGIVLTSNPPQYPHTCTSCSYKQTFGVRYPYVVTD